MRYIIIILALLGLTSAACAAPQPEAVLLPPTYVYHTPSGHRIVVDELCGPMLPTAAEDDTCVRFYDQSRGDWVVAPLSSWDSEADGAYVIIDVS